MRDTSTLGAAAAHIVCADILLAGFGASLAAEGRRYDVIADVDGRLIRIQVKATAKMQPRPSRPRTSPVYIFGTIRNRRPLSDGTQRIRRYSADEIDALACVALDRREVAYFAVRGIGPTGINLYPPGTTPWIRNGREERRCIDQFPFARFVGEYR